MASARPAPHAATSDDHGVAICVEQSALRDRVCAALTAGGHPVTVQSATVEGLLAASAGVAPACVVIAADRPDHAAVDTVRMVQSKLEGIPAVLVCRRAKGAEVRRALELGVGGVVLDDDAEDALAAVIAVVCAGQVSVPGGQRAEVRAQALTTREKQILALVITGMTNAQIATRLFLAESTIKSHLSSAFNKLGVSSRYEAATVILDPERGRGLGIREIRAEPAPLGA